MDSIVEDLSSQDVVSGGDQAADNALIANNPLNMSNAFAPASANIDPILWMGKDEETREDYLDLFWMDASEQVCVSEP